MIYSYYQDWNLEALSFLEDPLTDEDLVSEAKTRAEDKMQYFKYSPLAEPDVLTQFYKLVSTGIFFTNIDGEQEERIDMQEVPREEAEYIRILLKYPCEEYTP